MTLTFGGEALDLEPDFMLSYEELSDIMVELGAAYTRIQGNNCQADHCFFHENDKPTLGISLDSPHPWGCFSGRCDAKGKTVVSLVSRSLEVSKSQAVAWILQRFPDSRVASRRGLFETPYSDAEQRFVLSPAVLEAYPLSADNGIGYRALDYLSDQMGYQFCSHDQADMYHLGYDLKNHRLVFPVYHSDGALAGLVGRAMRDGVKNRYYNYDEGLFKKSLTLMGAEQPVDPAHPVVVVEGPTDYTYLRSCGVKNLRGFMGANFSETQAEMVMDLGLPVVPLFDLDQAGRDAQKKFREIASRRVRIKSFRYPPGSGKDPRSIPRHLITNLVESFGRLSLVSS